MEYLGDWRLGTCRESRKQAEAQEVLGSEGFGNVAELSRGRFSAQQQHEPRAARGDVADGTAAAQPPQAVNNNFKHLDSVDSADSAVAPAARGQHSRNSCIAGQVQQAFLTRLATSGSHRLLRVRVRNRANCYSTVLLLAINLIFPTCLLYTKDYCVCPGIRVAPDACPASS